jgi:hypothetical protein
MLLTNAGHGCRQEQDENIIDIGEIRTIGAIDCRKEVARQVARSPKEAVHGHHWDVIQDEATRQQSKSGSPMFGDSFPVST